MKTMAFGLVVALLFVGGSMALVTYAASGDDKCPGKDGAKCGAVQAAAKEGTACQRFASLTKSDDKCCAATASICPEKALSLAIKVRKESCPVASAAILATALPQIQCPDARAKLVADVKAKECEKEAAQMILAAIKDSTKESSPAPKGDVLAAAAKPSDGKPGAPACAKEGAALAKAGGSDCCAAERAAALAKAGSAGACAKEMAASFCPLKAEKLASAIRAESCCDRSAAILAEALPELTCKDAQAKLVKEIKDSDCSHEGAEAILAVSAKLTKKTEPVSAN